MRSRRNRGRQSRDGAAMALVEIAERGLYCRGGRLLRRSLVAGRAGRDHPLAQRPSALGLETAISRRRPNVPVLAGPRRRGRRRRLPYGESLDAERRASFVSSGRPHPRLGASADRTIAARSASSAATTRPRPIRPARRSSRSAATTSSPRRPSPCRSIAGLRRRDVMHDFDAWWQANQRRGTHERRLRLHARQGAARAWRSSSNVRGPILVHGALAAHFCRSMRPPASQLPETQHASARSRARPRRRQALVVAPPSALGSPWLRKFGPVSTAVASGWMRVRGTRRRRGVDRGFVLSDHADWPGLLAAIDATGAEEVWVTHGYTEPMSRYLNELGKARRQADRDALRRRSGRRRGRARGCESMRPPGIAQTATAESEVPACKRLRANSICELDGTTRTSEKVAYLEAYFQRRRAGRCRLGAVLPDRPKAEAARSTRGSCASGRRNGRELAALALRAELRSRRRLGRDDGVAAAAGRRKRPTNRWPTSSSNRIRPLAGATPQAASRARARGVARIRRAGTAGVPQADHRRVSRRRGADARRPRAGRSR